MTKWKFVIPILFGLCFIGNETMNVFAEENSESIEIAEELESSEQQITDDIDSNPYDEIIDIEPSEDIIIEEDISSEENGPSNDELFEQYVDKQFYGEQQEISSSPMLKAKRYTGVTLEGLNQILYDGLNEKIELVASGEITNTEFAFDSEFLGTKDQFWSAQDLGVDAIFDTERQLQSDVMPSLYQLLGFNLNTLHKTLLSNNAFNLYWYDKSVSGSFSLSTSLIPDDDTISLNKMTFKMKVAAEYSATGETDTYEVNETIGPTIQSASAYAHSIVSDYADLADYDKLLAYKDAVCDLVSYNHDAAASTTINYGNPWQLIWVFDNDPDTNVVCEGYSKAFKYLCELSAFDNPYLDCYLVSGDMNTGKDDEPHMWNIVSFGNDRNYLVDVTNSDKNTIGAGTKLFLVGTDGNVEDGYTFQLGTKKVLYKYGESSLQSYTTQQLTIVPTAYQAGSVAAYGINLSQYDLSLYVGKQAELTCEVVPGNATNTNVTWKSLDETIATVENGVINALKAGSTVIRAITDDGQYFTNCNVTVKGKLMQQANAALDLAGNVKVNYMLLFSDEVYQDSGAKLVFKVPFRNEDVVMNISEAPKDSLGYSVFAVEITSKEIAEVIEASIQMSSGYSEQLLKFGAINYCEDRIKNGGENIRNLCIALLNYGAAAQKYFDYDTDNLANKNLTEEQKNLSSVTLDTLIDYTLQIEGSRPSGIKRVDATLDLKATTTVNYIYTLENGASISDYTFWIDGQEVEPITESSNMYVISKEGIVSKKLDDLYTVVVQRKGDTNTFSIEFGPLSYAYLQLSNSSSSSAVKNLCKALYLYNYAANTYFNE